MDGRERPGTHKAQINPKMSPSRVCPFSEQTISPPWPSSYTSLQLSHATNPRFPQISHGALPISVQKIEHMHQSHSSHASDCERDKLGRLYRNVCASPPFSATSPSTRGRTRSYVAFHWTFEQHSLRSCRSCDRMVQEGSVLRGIVGTINASSSGGHGGRWLVCSSKRSW